MLVILVVEDFHFDSMVALGVMVFFYVGLSCASFQNVGNLIDCFFCITIGKNGSVFGRYFIIAIISNKKLET